METANTILEQLGGKKFIAMTGARGFVGSDRGLMFSLPTRKINKVRITLDPSDTYTVEFFKISNRHRDIALVASSADLMADNLAPAIEWFTGLRTSL